MNSCRYSFLSFLHQGHQLEPHMTTPVQKHLFMSLSVVSFFECHSKLAIQSFFPPFPLYHNTELHILYTLYTNLYNNVHPSVNVCPFAAIHSSVYLSLGAKLHVLHPLPVALELGQRLSLHPLVELHGLLQRLDPPLQVHLVADLTLVLEQA